MFCRYLYFTHNPYKYCSIRVHFSKMRPARCSMCLKRCKNVKDLIKHIKKHPKRDLLKNLFDNNNNHVLMKNTVKKKIDTVDKSEEIYFSDNIHIVCGKGKVVISDGTNSVEFKTKFEGREVILPIINENNNDGEDLEQGSEKYHFKIDITQDRVKSEEIYFNDNIHILFGKNKIIIGDGKNCVAFKVNLEDKNEPLVVTNEKLGKDECYFQIDITRIDKNHNKSLDDKSGKFYECHCFEPVEAPNASDTDSGSDSLIETKFVCEECCSGFDSEQELLEHIRGHMIPCRVCGESFPNQMLLSEHAKSHVIKVYLCHICNMEFFYREAFRRHTEAHYENYTLDTVVDMERDYNVQPYTNTMGYNESINQILHYLGHEVFIGDIEQHMQTVHYAYAC
ncbi:unnamed protein product [Brassicogethes aeneus]|uniref:C2H2-type domain-containing protein n=1 Tax=Brassicogethes aeneus TaxID=1431903 RepID=A0A9P0BGJ0_BRAAE|nr:unnamed protein product [Brassicogethes aeneus]